MKIVQNFLFLLSLSVLYVPQLQAQTAQEKAQVIQRISQGITWPQPLSTITVGVLGDKEMFKALSTSFQNQTIQGKPVEVKRWRFFYQVKPCQLFFISKKNASNLFFGDIRKKLQGTSTLILTEKPAMLKEGSHINLISTGQSIRYEVNTASLKQENIRLSAGVLQNAVHLENAQVKQEKKKSIKENLKGILKDAKEAISKDKKKETNKAENTQSPSPVSSKKNTGTTSKQQEKFIERVAKEQNVAAHKMRVLSNYIAALEQKLDENKISYQNLKKEYEEEKVKVEKEITELNLTIVTKDSLRKKDHLLAERKIALEKSQRKLAEVHANQNLTFAMLATVIALILLFASINFYKDKKTIQKQKDALAENLEEIATQRDEIETQKNKIEQEKHKSDSLLLNILPESTARELKDKGYATPQRYEKATVLFTDFKGFTGIAERLSPEEIIKELDYCFLKFDEIAEKYNLERIKIIGDAYMCAGGVPKSNQTNPVDAVKAGLEIQAFMQKLKQERKASNQPYFECRLGIHTGKVVAGVIGKKKFAYDIWGDTVNLASRMESSGEVGKVNISGETYSLIEKEFDCVHRGKVNAKGKGQVDMYFVKKIRES